MTLLERYREIEKAARKARVAQLYGNREEMLSALYAVNCAYDAEPNPDIALVEVKRIRMEEGEKSCATDEEYCPLLREKREGGGCYCAFVSDHIEQWHPHPDCPVWKEE